MEDRLIIQQKFPEEGHGAGTRASANAAPSNNVLSSLNASVFFPLVARLTSHPVMISDLEGGTVWVNDAFTRLSGWHLSEIVGRRPSEFLHGAETDPATVEVIRQRTVSGLAFQCEIQNYRRDGSSFWISLDAQPIHDELGKLCGYFSVQSDVSDRKKAELRWAREHRLLTAVASSLGAFVSRDDPKSAFNDILLELIDLTESEYGFIGEVLLDMHGKPWLKTYSMTNIAWDDESRRLYEKYSEIGFEFRSLETLFGKVLSTREPVISNSPANDPRSGGLPSGHPPLKRFLGLPISRDGQLIGMAGLANCPREYSEEDIEFLSPLLTSIGHVIDSYRRDLKRREVENSLRETEEWLEETSRIAEIGSWQLDVSTMQLRWSEQTRRIHEVPSNYRPEVGTAIDFYAPEARNIISDAVQNAVRNGTPWDLELPIITARGRRRWVRAIGHASDTEGKPTQLVGVFQDVTQRHNSDQERERLQDQFIKAQRMESVGRLAGGIAHDFNNMLAVVLGHAEMSLLDSNLSPQQRSHMKAVQVAGQRAASLTRQLLAFASRQHATPQNLNLNGVVRNLIELLRKSLGESIRLEWLPGDDLWDINIDPLQVDQMLACLCLNSKEAISESGRVLLSTRNERVSPPRQSGMMAISGDYVVMTLSDNGRGMDASAMANLFEPFNTTKSVGQGPGLGLATVYGIVQQNRGAIEVESDPLVGTIFRFYFPRVHLAQDEVETSVTSLSSENSVQESITVLLVEDEPVLLRTAKLAIRQLGHRVFTAPTVSQALQLVQTRGDSIQLVISDIVMPEMSGWELVRQIHSVKPDIRFVLMSGYQADASIHNVHDNHPFPVLNKPFDLQKLAAAIRHATESPWLSLDKGMQ